MCFNEPLLQWKSNKYYIIWLWICSFRYPACNTRAPYFDVWRARLHCIFTSYPINDRIFENKLLNAKCVFWVSLHPLTATFLILRRSEWDVIKTIYWSLCKVPVILVRYSWNLNFLTDFRKILKYQISWKSVFRNRLVPCGRTEGQTWRS